jgi:alpha-L-arabinofuranosidase
MFPCAGDPAVRHHFVSLLALTSVLAAAPTVAAQDVITVDVTSVLADVSRKPIGINVNFLLDDDANRTNAVEGLAEALRKAGVKYLRYPGGEKSDGYLWSIPPYTSSAPTLARWATGEYPQNREWPSYDRTLVESDGRTFKLAPLDFDEFMTVCKAIGCVPTIVVCYDSMYKAAQSGGTSPTRNQLLETAKEWVRYANITKGYNVKYWEIGNESYLQHYNGSASAANYARDLIDFSRTMKAMDPTIRIGANGGSDTWWQTVLPSAANAIDFLAVHNYFADRWGSYDHYQKNNVNLMYAVQAAQYAITTYAPAADRDRLAIAVTETNSVDWSGTWPHLNDMGHALALFDAFGAHLRNPKVAFTQLWNTRWLGNDTATTPSLWDTLDKYNDLHATGRSLAIWGQFLKEKLVASSSTPTVRSYATYSPSTGKLTIFLINKDTLSRGTSVVMKNGGTNFTLDTWVFRGTGASDLYPNWSRQSASASAGTVIPVTLDPVSITVLDITPDRSLHSVPGIIEAEDFRDGAYWDSTPGNKGAAYRVSDVDIQGSRDTGGGFNVGWIAAGEWLDYGIRVQSAGFYALSVRVASRYAGTSLRVLVNGEDVTGSVTVPATGDWQAWRTVTHGDVYLPVGIHRLTLSAGTGGFNVNWMSLSASAGPTHALPAIIQAEDFREGGYWDSTSGNNGGLYRTTDVDVQTCQDAGGGFNVGWIAPGEWLEYTIVVGRAGYYDLSARVASRYSGKSFSILWNGTDVTGIVSVPNTGGWQNWETVTRRNIYLPAGTHTARVVARTNAFNLNWLTFTAAGATAAAASADEQNK